MAEYCSQCSPFKPINGYDINLFKIALKLERGHSASFLCEGCSNRAIYKDENGLLYLVKDQNNELIFSLVRIEEL